MESRQEGNGAELVHTNSLGASLLSYVRTALSSPFDMFYGAWNELCEECRGIDLQRTMSINMHLPQRYQYGLLIADVGDRFKKLPDNGCALCQILFTCRLNPLDMAESHIGDEIRAFSFVQWYEGVDTSIYMMPDSGISLCIVPGSFGFGQPPERMARHFREHGHIFCYDSLKSGLDPLAPRVMKRDFDPAVIQAWLGFCQAHHTSCKPQSSPPPGLKLIDCKTFSLIPASSGLPYVALSYVWGQVKAVQIEPGVSRIPASKLPATISDAIQVTIALGFRYLWVDQYCIDQRDPTSKHEQIKQMDLVYNNAELTIVAAAGHDQSYGLPGVASRLRTPQRTVKAGRYKIVETMPDPHYKVRASTWFTRAWTFQEGLFSRRSLAFTDDQVYYECAGINFHEAVNFYSDDSGPDSHRRAPLLGTNLKYATPHRSFTQVQRLLEQFTARKMTYDDDSLDPFLGVLRYFGSQASPVSHLWGVPFIVHDTMVRHYASNVDAYLIDGLCWRHVHNCWEEQKLQPKRRPKFPSWSWAGWAGAIQHDREPHTHQMSPFGPLLSKLQLEYDGGNLKTFDEAFVDSSASQKFSYPKALLVDALMVQASDIECRFNPDGDNHQNYICTVAQFPATLSISQGPCSPTALFSALRKQVYKCIVLGVDNRLGMKPNVNLFMLVVKGGNGEPICRCGMITAQVPHLGDVQPFLDRCPSQRLRLV